MGFPSNPVVTDTISLSGAGDTYATHWALIGKGGQRSIDTLANMNLIPLARREFGMLVTVNDDPTPTNNKTYILANLNLGGVDNVLTNNANFIPFSGGGGGTITGADNGLNLNGTVVELGGVLTTPLLINGSDNAVNVDLIGENISISSNDSTNIYGLNSVGLFTSANNIGIGFDTDNCYLNISPSGKFTFDNGTTPQPNDILALDTLVNGIKYKNPNILWKYRSSSSLLSTDNTLDITSGNTITLPTAIGVIGKVFVIKNSSNTGFATINLTGGQNLDGYSNFILYFKQSIRVQSNGTNWIILDYTSVSNSLREIQVNTAANTGDYIIVGTFNNAMILTLPLGSSALIGKEYIIKQTGTNTLTVQGSGGQTIDGLASIVLTTGQCITIYYGATTQWIITSKYL